MAGMIGAIVHATAQDVEIVVGKPSSLMAEAALETLGLPPERCLVIGDSLESDIRLGHAAGMRTALVLTGSTDLGAVRLSPIQPEYIWNSIRDVSSVLGIERSKMN